MRICGPPSGGKVVRLTDWTPGKAWTRASDSSKYARRRGDSCGYLARLGVSASVNTPSGLKPLGTASRRKKLLIIRPAPTSRTKASASSAIIKAGGPLLTPPPRHESALEAADCVLSV